MYPSKKMCTIIGGIVIASLLYELFDENPQLEQHVHIDYSHLAYAFTTSSGATIVESMPSGDFG